MHGNVRYMHCSDEDKECSKKFYRGPEMHEVVDRTNHVPLCKECGAPMKPHCMFFDECYSECYYRQKTMAEIEDEKMDCLIVIGTALQTGGARRMVNNALKRQDIPVIEVNIEPMIDEGFALTIAGKSEVALEAMFKEYYRLSAPASAAAKPGAAAAGVRKSSWQSAPSKPVA